MLSQQVLLSQDFNLNLPAVVLTMTIKQQLSDYIKYEYYGNIVQESLATVVLTDNKTTVG